VPSFLPSLLAITVLLFLVGIPYDQARGYSASNTQLVKEINLAGDSDPGNLTSFNGMLLFTASDGLHGFELWRSDGTAAGTVLVKDICPGTCSSNPQSLTVFNGSLYFVANDGVHGVELWKTDGTTAGTVIVNQGPSGSYPTDLTVFQNKLFFSACDSTNGCELWTSNGTASGTGLVKDICPGTCNSLIDQLTPVSGQTVGSTLLYFAATDGVNGQELWKTDGTTSGTVMVKDICPGSCSSNPYELTVVHRTVFASTLFFEACSSTTYASCGLWESDGTNAGTVLVRDINPGGTSGSDPCSLTAYGRLLFFNANNVTYGRELWRSDGTASGTVLVKDINPGYASSMPFCGPAMTVFNGNLFFTANDGVHGTELWSTNGTDAGTNMVKDINPGTNSSYPYYLTPVGNTLLFSAHDGVHGYELWRSDGTASGTVMVKDICPGFCSSAPSGLTAVGNVLFFAASDGSQASGAHGVELWMSQPDTGITTPTLPAPAIFSLGIVLILGANLLTRRKCSQIIKKRSQA
jgi:ELWxxDGT repeat protein